MRYLSFDIECAKVFKNSSPICNFGYAIYNEKFERIEKRDIIINPRSSFKLKGRKNREDITMSYTEEEYFKAKKFTYYYSEIKELLEAQNQIIMNHSVTNDISYLLFELNRYKLPIIRFVAYDIVDLFKALTNKNKDYGLIKITNDYLGFSKLQHHKADDDAEAALLFFIEACKIMEVNPTELIEIAELTPISSENPIRRKKNESVDEIIKRVKSHTIKLSEDFQGKLVSASIEIEKNDDLFEDILTSVFQLGGNYTKKVSEADIFIYNDNIRCKRFESYEHNTQKGKCIYGYKTIDYFEDVNPKISLLAKDRLKR